MIEAYGRKMQKQSLLKHVGDIDQICSIKLVEHIDGAERGVRLVVLKNGVLSLDLVVDRSLDIARADYKGIPLCWISPTGVVSPHSFEPEGFGWLRGFFGGLMTTCGLTYLGAPCVDQGEPLGLHGRISYSPAKLISYGGNWVNDEYVMHVEAEAKEAKVFEPYLTLRRRVETKMFSKNISVHDVVTNRGWSEQPMMIAYHINIGFPILTEDSQFISTSSVYVPRDEQASIDADRFNSFEAPQQGYREKVYFHKMEHDEKGLAYACIVNRRIADGLAVCVKFDSTNLPLLYEWKMMGAGTYVVGLEPANCLPMGRSVEREWGLYQP